MKRLGIKYQLRIITLIPVVLVALLCALLFNYQYNYDLKQHMKHLGEAYLNQLLPLAQFAMLQEDNHALQALLDAVTINPEIKAVAFYNKKGQLLAYRGGRQAALRPHPSSPQVKTGTIESKKLTPYTINFITPIPLPQFNLYSSLPNIVPLQSLKTNRTHDFLGWISINMDNKFMLVKRYEMIMVTLLITFFCLSMAFIVHYFLSKRIYRPIARLRRSMKQILSNEFETGIKISSAGELGVIEQGCVHLQQQYLHTINELNQHIEVATIDLQQSLELLEEKNIELTLEKKKMEERGRQKSEFIASMSHEVRTPMNGVIGFTNVLLETKLDTLQLDYVKTIKSSAQDLLTIINDILDYSKIDAGKLHLDCIPLNIRACIDEVLALLNPNAHQKGIDLIPITAVTVPKTILGDPWRIKQIISNLVSNAVKFTDYGYVLIRTKVEEESDGHYTLCLSVSDTGIGISPEAQATLFNAFSQVDTATTRRFGGSGLGLVICKKLAEHMQGHISIQSEPHKGATFSVTLKLAKLAAFEVEKHQANHFANLNILCFDDNPLHLEALCNGLGYLGVTCIRVHAFNQLETAFDQQTNCDLAFIHINQGSEQQIAHILRKQTIPCLLISKSFIQNYQSLGAKGLLFKPPNIQKLQEAIESTLKNTKAEASQLHNSSNDHLDTFFNHSLFNINEQGITEEVPLHHPSVETNILSKATTSHIPHKPLIALRKKLRLLQPNLLIAEDNFVNRMLLHSILKENASVETVTDGEEAVLACNRKQFSAILLDLQMPKRNGLEAASMIKRGSILNKYTPIILISANGYDLNQASLQQAGIDLCLQKPINEEKLLQHLLTFIDQTKVTAINWSLCIEKVSGNQALAVEFLARFVEELQKNRIDFLQLFQQDDRAGLEKIAHKLHGACCFCGVNQLQQVVSKLENRARYASHVDELQELFLQLIEEIDAVLSEYEISYRNKNVLPIN